MTSLFFGFLNYLYCFGGPSNKMYHLHLTVNTEVWLILLILFSMIITISYIILQRFYLLTQWVVKLKVPPIQNVSENIFFCHLFLKLAYLPFIQKTTCRENQKNNIVLNLKSYRTFAEMLWNLKYIEVAWWSKNISAYLLILCPILYHFSHWFLICIDIWVIIIRRSILIYWCFEPLSMLFWT